MDTPGVIVGHSVVNARARRNSSRCRNVVLHRQPNLFDIVATGHTASGFPRHLDRRQQKPHQHSDNRNDHQQFNESKCPHCVGRNLDLDFLLEAR